MKSRLLAVLILVAWSIPARAWRIEPVSSLHKMTATAPGVLERYQSTPIKLRATRGEWECFQVVVTANAEPLSQVQVALSPFSANRQKQKTEFPSQLYWENFVIVDKPSGNRRLEKLWWPDALIPTALQPKSIEANRAAVLWVALQVPHGTVPGRYTATVSVSAGGKRKSLPVVLHVKPVTMPAPTLRGNVAVYYDTLRDWYAKNWRPLDDARFTQMKREYYDFLLEYRINAYDLPVGWGGEAADAYLRDPRVLSVRMPPLDNPEFAPALERLKRLGPLSKAYYYWIDEPAPERYEEVRTTTARLHAADPGLRHCVTAHPNQALADAVDIWCPNIGDFFGLWHLDAKRLQSERLRGRETWWYTMVEPKYPYPTWLLDDDALGVRSYGVLMAHTGINGFVYSMAHGWGPKPLENLQSYAGTNGDGTLLYPAEIVDPSASGPLPSIRLMLLRDAIEEYELLKLLPRSTREQLTAGLLDDRAPLLLPERDSQQWEQFRDKLFLALSRRGFVPATFKPKSTPKDVDFRVGSGPSLPTPVKPPVIDGKIDDVVWNDRTRFRDEFRRFTGAPAEKNSTSLWVTADQDNLYIAARASFQPITGQPPAAGDWVGVDLAPLDARERWRFVMTPRGRAAVERHTREGQFAIEGLEWQHGLHVAADHYAVEMRIPLELIGDPTRFRFNVLRRLGAGEAGIRYVVRAYPNAGDVTLMPVARR